MSARSGFLIIAATLLLLLVGILYVMNLIVSNESDIAAAEARRLESYKLADELRQSTDDLTRMVRTYVVTADPIYEAYYDEILDIRNGDAPRPVDYEGIYWDFVTATRQKPRPDDEAVALETLMREMNFTGDEFALLRLSQLRSDSLVNLERRAFNVVKGLYPDEEGEFVVQGDSDLSLARTLVHGNAYHVAKADIMEPLQEFTGRVDARTAAEVEQLRIYGQRLSQLALGMVVVAVVLVPASYFLIRRRVTESVDEAPAGDSGSRTTAGESRSSSLVQAGPLIAAAAVAVVAVVGFTWWTQSLAEQRAREDIGYSLRTVLTTTSRATGDWIGEREAEARVWTQVPEIVFRCQELLDLQTTREGLLNSFAQTRLREIMEPLLLERDYEEFLLLTSNGLVLAGVSDERVGTEIAGELPHDFLEQAQAEPDFSVFSLPQARIGDGSAEASGAGSSVLVGAAIPDPIGTEKCILALRIDPEKEFTEILQRGRMGGSGESYAFNRSGQLISESRFDDQLREIGLISEGERGILSIDVRDPGGDMTEGFQPTTPIELLPLTFMAGEAIAGRPGMDLDGYNDYRGVPVIGAWTWDEANGLGIATEIDVAEAYASLRSSRQWAIASSSLTVGLIVALTGLFVWNRQRMAATQTQLQETVIDLDVAQRQTEAANHAISSLASELNTDVILETICVELAKALDVSQAAVALLDDEGAQLHVTVEYRDEDRPSSIGIAFPTDSPWNQVVIRDKQPLAILADGSDPHFAEIREVMRQRESASLLIVPLIVRDELVGTLGLDTVEGRDFSDAEIELALNVARVAGQALERARLYATLQSELAERERMAGRLKESEERLNFALEGSNDGLWDWNVQTGECYFSPRWQNMLGYDFGDVEPVIDAFRDIAHPEDLPRLMEINREHFEGKRPYYEAEFRARTKSGEWMWILSRAKLVERDETGEPLRMVGTHADIGERKLMEEALRESGAKHETLFQNSPLGMILFNNEGVIIECNDQFVELMGSTKEQLIGFYTLKDATDPAVREGLGRALNGELVEFEGEYTSATGDLTRYLRIIYNPVDPQQLPTEVIATLEDVTSRKEMEVQLQENALEAQLLYQSADLAAEAESVDDALQEVVNAICSLTGWPVGHVYAVGSGRQTDELFPTDIWFLSDQEEFSEFREVTERTTFAVGIGLPGRVLESGEVAWIRNVQEDENFPRRHLTQNLVVKGAFGVPVKVSGKVVSVLEFFSDRVVEPDEDLIRIMTHVAEQLSHVFERREAAEALQVAAEAAQAANRAKSAFLANMSHELRTPMNAIIGYSEMLAEDAEDEGYDELVPDLEKINTAGRHLLGLINDVLDLSKIEAGRMDLYLERFDIRQMLEETVSTVRPVVEKNNNEFVVDAPDTLGNMRADLTKVRQSVFNLLSNAAKFTEGGTVTLAARREPRRDGDWIIMSVTDTGIGIPEDKIEHVFEEFGQADESTTRNYGGTGLGLPISQRFCRMMGGDISVTSENGVGSTFAIELPAEVKAATLAKAAAGEQAKDLTRIAEGERPILVIDDDLHARELLLRTLEADGHLVVTAESGEEGLDIARRLKPSLITLDIMMPGMDGWATLRALKADSETEHIPVVMVSIVSDKDVGYALGAVESLTKPVDRGQLLQVVQQYADANGGHRALIVEDDASTRSLLSRTLAEAGWVVAEAENGAAALERVAAHKPDLILLDLMMPVMDGFEFVLVLRQQEDKRSIPIVVVTAKDLTAEDRRQLAGGVEHIVDKGAFTQDEMLQQVRDLVGYYSDL